MILSMLTEDTIETQDGVTLFTYFTALFALSYPPECPMKDEKQ
jgi:hypothetical protein